MEEVPAPQPKRPSAWGRIIVALLLALVFAGGVYLLVGRYDRATQQPRAELIGIGFLIVLPLATGALATFISDPLGEHPRRAWQVPLWLMLAVIVASAIVLREGTICILMLTPFWLTSAMAGGWLTYRLRKLFPGGRSYSASLLAAPLLVLQIEPLIPIPETRHEVERSVIVAASAQRLWPLVEGVGAVRADEGIWTVSHDLIGLPRPRQARLDGGGFGATRWAVWGEKRDIVFREMIDHWSPGSGIGWRFAFDDLRGWESTDRHLMPDGPYYRIERGGYRLEPLGDGRTRVTLTTRYSMRTHFTAYAALWGELFLGDIENNVLAIIRERAERGGKAPTLPSPSPGA